MFLELWALFSVAWIWFHIYLIYVFERVLIYEYSRIIITGELLLSTVILILWIVRTVRMMKHG